METPILDDSKEATTEEQATPLTPDLKDLQEELEKYRLKREFIRSAKEEEAKAEYNRLKAEIQVYPRKLKVKIFLIIVVFVVMCFSLFLEVFFFGQNTIVYMQTCLLLLTIPTSTSILCIQDAKVIRKQVEVYQYELSHAQDEVEEDLFKNSIKLSYTYLDQYYAQTRKQAQQGFYITLSVALFGAVLIGVGVVALFQEKITPAYITCASGAITEFISAVFFYLYNKTVTSMNSYHDKLVLSQNIAFALRIAGEMEGMDEKNKAKLAIINELVKDVNAQMMKSDADTDEPPKKDKPSDSDTPSE